MKTSWIIGLWVLFIGGAIISGILEMQLLGGSSDTAGVFNSLMKPPSFANLNFLGVTGAVIGLVWDWIQAFWNMLLWNYAFFADDWAIVKWLICYPISIGLVVSLVLAVRGTSSG